MRQRQPAANHMFVTSVAAVRIIAASFAPVCNKLHLFRSHDFRAQPLWLSHNKWSQNLMKYFDGTNLTRSCFFMLF